MLNKFAYIIISLSELFVTHRAITRLFGCSRKKGMFPYVLYAIYLLLSVTQILTFHFFHFTMIVSVVLTYFVCIGYESNFTSRILTIFLKVSTGIVCEGCVDLLIIIAFKINSAEIAPGKWYYPLTVVLTAVCKILIILLLEKIVLCFKRRTHLLYTSIIGMISVLLISILYMIVTFANTAYLPAALIIICLLLVTISLCVGLLHDQVRIQKERLRLGFLEKQNQEQVAHYTALYDRNYETHRLRHDLHNFLLSAQTLIELGDIEKLKEHIEKQREAIRPEKLTDTGNPLLDAVLSAKQHDSPQIDFQILLPQLHCEHIDAMDAAMLLAAALDNAVEGCADCPEPYIQIRVEQKGCIIHFDIQNPTQNKPRERLGRLVSTKSEPEKHGYGVLSMRRIAERYSGNLTWTVENGVFTLRVLMQDIPPVPSPQK